MWENMSHEHEIKGPTLKTAENFEQSAKMHCAQGNLLKIAQK